MVQTFKGIGWETTTFVFSAYIAKVRGRIMTMVMVRVRVRVKVRLRVRVRVRAITYGTLL